MTKTSKKIIVFVPYNLCGVALYICAKHMFVNAGLLHIRAVSPTTIGKEVDKITTLKNYQRYDTAVVVDLPEYEGISQKLADTVLYRSAKSIIGKCAGLTPGIDKTVKQILEWYESPVRFTSKHKKEQFMDYMLWSINDFDRVGKFASYIVNGNMPELWTAETANSFKSALGAPVDWHDITINKSTKVSLTFIDKDIIPAVCTKLKDDADRIAVVITSFKKVYCYGHDTDKLRHLMSELSSDSYVNPYGNEGQCPLSDEVIGYLDKHQ